MPPLNGDHSKISLPLAGGKPPHERDCSATRETAAGVPAAKISGKKYWRSLNELADKPEFREFVEREFPKQASEFTGGGEGRRTFLKIMGASVALAGLASCRRWPEEKLAPYAHRPANRMDGVPVHYATACEIAGMGYGVLAVSFDGRPIKVDGNPTHPLTQGASDMFLQASVLNVYDPDRSRGILKQVSGKPAEGSWDEFLAAIKSIDKSKLAVLSEASRSPSVARLRGDLIKAGAKWFEYEAVGTDNQRAGAQQVFGGQPLRAVPHLDQAQVIVSIDADLFHGEPLSIMFNRDFAAGRKLHDSTIYPKATMNRLYVVECGFTITGSMADHRRAVKPSDILPLLWLVSAILNSPNNIRDIKSSVGPDLWAFAEAMVKDIKALGSQKALFVAGSRQPASVHAAVATINASLNAPVDYYAEPEDPRSDSTWKPAADQLTDFIAAAKNASAILIIGANPALTAPAISGLAKLLDDAKLSIHVGTHVDETAQACTWHLPQAHYLEAWGDVRTLDGTVSIAQPLIEPIFGGKSTLEILAAFLGIDKTGEELVQETAKSDYMKANYSNWQWKKALHDGIVAGTAYAPVKPVLKPLAVVETRTLPGDLELALYVGAAHDGRFANNGWLMELPDPMTRVSWESPLILSPKTAKKLGLDSDDVVKIKTPGNKDGLEAAVYVLPGHPDDTLSLAVGYGRKTLGSIADGDGTGLGIGVNAYALRDSSSLLLNNVTLEKVGDKTRLVACVQDHHTIDAVGKNRLNTIVPDLVVEGTLEQYKKKPALGARKIVALSIFDEYNYDKGQPWVMAKWGMAIDLTTCTGCSACVIACQAENNIPIVGKQMVYRGREMHWLRIDRYFKFAVDEKTGKYVGDAGQGTAQGTDTQPDEVQVVHQPLLCMHCENAPCEEVCPVAATTHSHEGLNMMTYNRCIGTRYCSNNCPYKVRRFNFFDYNAGATTGKDQNLYTPNLLRDDLDELVKMQKNPQVTVRSRGVMEKCTYCVQRIEKARIDLRAANRSQADTVEFKDGTVITACQQACPTQAIVFGDLNDKNSRVAKHHALAQSYGLLDPELNTKPRTQYLAKIRNNVPGIDPSLYNEHTASEGWFFENKE